MQTLPSVDRHPVVHAVFDFPAVLEDLGKEFSEEIIVRGFLETELANIVEVDGELLCIRDVDGEEMSENRQVKSLRKDSPSNPSASSLIGVVCFFSPIFSYFCLLVAALSPCQGSPPRKK